MSVNLFDYASEQWMPVPDEQVTELVRSGSHGFGKKDEVSIILPNGNPFKVAPEDAFKAFKLGARYETADESRKRAFKQEYGQGFGNALLAFGAGVVRGAVTPVSDAVIGQFANPEILKTYEDEFGGLSTLGEVVGSIAPVVLTGGIGGVAKGGLAAAARFAPSAIIARGATAAGRATANRLLRKTATDSMLRKVGQTSVAAGVAGAIEGGAWETGQQISEAVLEDKPKSASQIIANISFTAFLGGALGAGITGTAVASLGGLKATGRGAKKMFERIMDTELVDGFSDAVSKGVATLTGEDPTTVSKMLRLGKKHVDAKKALFEEGKAAGHIVDEIKAERLAVRAQEVRNRMAERERKLDFDEFSAGRMEAIEEEKIYIKDDRAKFIKEMSDDDIAVLVDDLEIHKKLGDITTNIDELKDATIGVKRRFIEDNYELISRHIAEKTNEASDLARLNAQAIGIREKMGVIRKDGADDIAWRKWEHASARDRRKQDLALLKAEHHEFLAAFTDKDIDLGLRQLREQGMLTEDLLNLDKLNVEQKRKVAQDNAEFMFQQVDTEAQRVAQYADIQEKIIADNLLKVGIDDHINTLRQAVKHAKVEVKTEMQELLENADAVFASLTVKTHDSLTEVMTHIEALTQFFQRRGVEFGRHPKEGFYSQILPKVTDGADGSTFNIINELRDVATRARGVIRAGQASADSTTSGVAHGLRELVDNFEDAVDDGILQAAVDAGILTKADYKIAAKHPVTRQTLANQIMSDSRMRKSEKANQALFWRIDELKRRVQENVENMPAHISMQVREKNTYRNVVTSLDDILKRKEYFGEEAVEMFTEINAAMSEFLRIREVFKPALTAQMERKGARYLQDRTSKVEAVGSILRNINKPHHGSSRSKDILERFLQVSRNLEEKMTKHYNVPNDLPALVRKEVLAEADDAVLEGFQGTGKMLRSSIENLEGYLKQAKKSADSLEAYRKVTGQNVPISDASDSARLAMQGYSTKKEALKELEQELRTAEGTRRRLGVETFAESKRYAAETKKLAGELKEHLPWAKLQTAEDLARFAAKKADLKFKLSKVQETFAVEKLGGKTIAAAKKKELNRKTAQLNRELAAIDRKLTLDEDKLRKDIRDALAKEDKRLNDLKLETLTKKTNKEIKDLFRKEERERHTAKHRMRLNDQEKTLHGYKVELDGVQRDRVRAQKLSKIAKRKKKVTLDIREAELKASIARVENEIKKRKNIIDAVKLEESQQLDTRRLELLAKEIAAQDTAKRLGSGLGGATSSILAGALGAIPFGIGGGLVTATVASMFQPATFGRMTVALWGISDAAEVAIEAGLDSVIDSIVKKALPVKGITKPNLIPAFLGPLVGLADSDADRRSPPTEYSKAVSRLSKLATNEGLKMKMLEDSVAPIAEEMPEIAGEMQAQAANTIEYMYNAMPRPIIPKEAQIIQRAYEPPESEVRRFARVVEMCEKPIETTVEGLTNDTLTVDQVSALSACYPEIHKAFVVGLHERLADLGGNIPYNKRLTFGKLAGANAESTVNPGFVTVMQGLHGQPQAGAQPAMSGRQTTIPLKEQGERMTLPMQRIYV